MNTDVAAWLWAEPGPADIWLPEVEAFFAEVEAELSRFRPDSGLSRLNAAAGHGEQKVSAMLAQVLQMALDAKEYTGGIFDPTVLSALQAAGYDRSFELLREHPGRTVPERGRSNEDSPQAIEFDRVRRSVSLPEGAQIDLGGIAKGWTVDRAAELLGAWGAALVDAGGDIRATEAPGGEPWPVAVENPFKPDEDLAVARLTDGAIATSSVLRRKWAIERTRDASSDRSPDGPAKREPIGECECRGANDGAGGSCGEGGVDLGSRRGPGIYRAGRTGCTVCRPRGPR